MIFKFMKITQSHEVMIWFHRIRTYSPGSEPIQYLRISKPVVEFNASYGRVSCKIRENITKIHHVERWYGFTLTLRQYSQMIGDSRLTDGTS